MFVLHRLLRTQARNKLADAEAATLQVARESILPSLNSRVLDMFRQIEVKWDNALSGAQSATANANPDDMADSDALCYYMRLYDKDFRGSAESNRGMGRDPLRYHALHSRVFDEDLSQRRKSHEK